MLLCRVGTITWGGKYELHCLSWGDLHHRGGVTCIIIL